MIQIKKAAPKDIAEIKAIEIRCKLSSWSVEDYREELDKPESFLIIAKFMEKTVGFALARLIMNDSFTIKYSEIEIYNIAVLSEYRRLSAASKLLQTILRIGLEKGAGNIFLEVRKSNLIAQKFYRKFSFQIIGERRNFYTNPPENGFLMSLELKSI